MQIFIEDEIIVIHLIVGNKMFRENLIMQEMMLVWKISGINRILQEKVCAFSKTIRNFTSYKIIKLQ